MKVERLKGLPFNLTEEEAEEIFNEFFWEFFWKFIQGRLKEPAEE